MRLGEQTLLEFRIELEELITEREAMRTLNAIRESKGESLGYDDTMFFDVRRRMEVLREGLIVLGEK